MADDNGGNGDEQRKGALLDLATLQREDGIISRMALSQGGDKSGVLAKSMSSIVDNKDYRQELKTGYFTSPRKQMQMVLAIEEMRECGIDATLVIDLLIAQKAGTEGGLMHEIFTALTHTTFNTNYTGKSGNRWWHKGESKSGSQSPLD